jgi:hypothetical protein
MTSGPLAQATLELTVRFHDLDDVHALWSESTLEKGALQVELTKGRVRVRIAGYTDVTFLSYTPPADKWVSLAVVMMETGLALYADGKLAGFIPAGGSSPLGTGLVLGAAELGASRLSNGDAKDLARMDLTRVRLVASGNYSQLPSLCAAPNNDVLLLWEFEDCGETVADLSGNGNTPRVVQAQWLNEPQAASCGAACRDAYLNAGGFFNGVICTPSAVCKTELEFELVALSPTASRKCQTATACGLPSTYTQVQATLTSDRICGNVRECSSTDEYETVAPTTTSDRGCAPFRNCAANQYEIAGPTATSDRQCNTTSECVEGEQFEVQPLTNTSDRICGELSICSLAQGTYELTAPTPTSNRVCASVATCLPPATFETTAPTPTSNRICQAVTTCRPIGVEFERDAPTATSDRFCDLVTSCEDDEYETKVPTATTDRGCALLSICTAQEYELTPPTSTTDRECVPARVCQPGLQYELVPLTQATDRICAPLAVCDRATQFENVPPTASTNRVCARATMCAPGFEESVPLTATNDRNCTRCVQGKTFKPAAGQATVCEAVQECQGGVQYEAEPPTPEMDRICLRINLCPVGQTEVAAPTVTSDRQCQACQEGKVKDQIGQAPCREPRDCPAGKVRRKEGRRLRVMAGGCRIGSWQRECWSF